MKTIKTGLIVGDPFVSDLGMGWLRDIFGRPRKKTNDSQNSGCTARGMCQRWDEPGEEHEGNSAAVIKQAFGIRDSGELNRARLDSGGMPKEDVRYEEASIPDPNNHICVSAMRDDHERSKECWQASKRDTTSRIGRRSGMVCKGECSDHEIALESPRESYLSPKQHELANSLSRSLVQVRDEVSALTAALDKLIAK